MAKKTGAYEAPTPASDKKKALDTAIAQIEKSFGKGAVMRLGDKPEMNVEAIPTGSLALDAALGIGGVPKGRIIEIYGPESSGKTTIALHVIAEVQKQGGEAAFIDAEHALDPVYASNLGVDIGDLYVSQPDNGEQALDITEALVRSSAVDIIVVDKNGNIIPNYWKYEVSEFSNLMAEYNSLRIEGEDGVEENGKQYHYAYGRKVDGGIEVRAEYYEYYTYQHTQVLKDGIEEPLRSELVEKLCTLCNTLVDVCDNFFVVLLICNGTEL